MRSTTQPVRETVHREIKNKDHGISIILCDSTKDLDSEHHHILYKLLEKYGTRGLAYSLVKVLRTELNNVISNK